MIFVLFYSYTIILLGRHNLNQYLPDEMSVSLNARSLKYAFKGGGGELRLGYLSHDDTTVGSHDVSRISYLFKFYSLV